MLFLIDILERHVPSEPAGWVTEFLYLGLLLYLWAQLHQLFLHERDQGCHLQQYVQSIREASS